MINQFSCLAAESQVVATCALTMLLYYTTTATLELCLQDEKHIAQQEWKIAPVRRPMAGNSYVMFGRHFEWAHKMSYYFNTDYEITRTA